MYVCGVGVWEGNNLIGLMFFQLYETSRLQEYNILLKDVRKSTMTTLNNVAVALLNKVSEEPWALQS